MKKDLPKAVSTILENKNRLKDDDNTKNKILDLISKLYGSKMYKELSQLLDNIPENLIPKEKLCDVSSYYLITKVKLNSTNVKDLYYNTVKNCNTEMAKVSLELYETLKVIQEVKGNVR